MRSPLNGLLDRIRPRHYGRKPPLVLINGLAEQAESWYRNRRFWGRFFDVHLPEHPGLRGRCAAPPDRRRGADLGRLPRRAAAHLPRPVRPDAAVPPRLQQPGREGRGRVRGPLPRARGTHRAPLPVGDGRQGAAADHRRGRRPRRRTRWSGASSTSRDSPTARCSGTTSRSSRSRKWKSGFLKTVRGTLDHTVRERLHDLKCPTLLVTGANDKICCPKTAEEASREIPAGPLPQDQEMRARTADRKALARQPSGRRLPQFADADLASILDPTHPREADPSNAAMTTATPAADPKSNPNLRCRHRRCECHAGAGSHRTDRRPRARAARTGG